MPMLELPTVCTNCTGCRSQAAALTCYCCTGQLPCRVEQHDILVSHSKIEGASFTAVIRQGQRAAASNGIGTVRGATRPEVALKRSKMRCVRQKLFLC
jgi:hypothetical protein